MKNKIVTSLTGVVLAGALIMGQLTPGVFADEGTTSLAISETEASDAEEAEEAEEEAEVTEAKTHTKLETVTTDDVLVTAVDVSGGDSGGCVRRC